MEYIKQNYFELLTAGILVVAGATRILFPDLRAEEAKNLPFGSELSEWAIIVFELAAPYFLLVADKRWKHYYLVTLAIGVLALTAYYIATCTKLLDFRNTCIYTNTPLAVVLHGVYVMIFLWLAFIKG